MEYFTRDFYEMLLDLAALSICGFTVLFIIYSKFKGGTEKIKKERQKQTSDFSSQVLTQLIKLQFDRSLADTVAVINNGQLLDNISVQQQKFGKSSDSKILDKYDEAADLVQAGLNSYAIADRVKLPQGEIELIVNMNRLRNESAQTA